MTRIIKAAVNTGVIISGLKIYPDGTMELKIGHSNICSGDEENPWDSING